MTEPSKIPQLFLEKLELLTEEERRILIKTIDWLNHPIFVREESIHECKHKWVKTDNTIGGWKIGDKQSCTKCGAVKIPVL